MDDAAAGMPENKSPTNFVLRLVNRSGPGPSRRGLLLRESIVYDGLSGRYSEVGFLLYFYVVRNRSPILNDFYCYCRSPVCYYNDTPALGARASAFFAAIRKRPINST